MEKCLKLIFIFIACSGCLVYDPPENEIVIHNYSDKAIYVSYGCNDEIDCNRKLMLFEVLQGKVLDEYDRQKKDTISPSYRINAYSYGELKGFGIGEPEIGCADKTLKLFFIREYDMRNRSWEEICSGKYYEKAIYSEEQLHSLDWQIPYSY